MEKVGYMSNKQKRKTRKPFCDKTNQLSDNQVDSGVNRKLNRILSKMNNTDILKSEPQVVITRMPVLTKENIPPLIKSPVSKKLTDTDILELLQCDVVQPTPPHILEKRHMRNKSMRKCLLNLNLKDANLKTEVTSNTVKNVEHVSKVVRSTKNEIKNYSGHITANSESISTNADISNRFNSIDDLSIDHIIATIDRNEVPSPQPRHNLRQKTRIDYTKMINEGKIISKNNTSISLVDPTVNIQPLDNIVDTLNIPNKSEIKSELQRRTPVYLKLRRSSPIKKYRKADVSTVYEFNYDSNEEPGIKKKRKAGKKRAVKNKEKNFFTDKPMIKMKIPRPKLNPEKNISVTNEQVQKNTQSKDDNIFDSLIVDHGAENIVEAQNDNVCDLFTTACASKDGDEQNNEMDNDCDMDRESVCVEEDNHDVIYNSFRIDGRSENVNEKIDETILKDFAEDFHEVTLQTNSPWRVDGPVINRSLFFETKEMMLPRFSQDLPINHVSMNFSPANIRQKSVLKTPSRQTECIDVGNSEVTRKTLVEVQEPSEINEALKKVKQASILSFMNKTVTNIKTPKKRISNKIDSENESTPSQNRPSEEVEFPFTPILKRASCVRKVTNAPLQAIDMNSQSNCTNDSSEDSMFGFKSLSEESPVKIGRNRCEDKENVGKPTRISPRALRRILNRSRKADAESQQKNDLENVTVTVEGDNVEQVETVSIDNLCENDNEADSIGLFKDEEDVSLITRKEAPRRSYARTIKKKRRHLDESDHSENEGDEEAFVHLKKKKRKPRTKKEDEEAERWAQQFNSMCDEVEQFELLVDASLTTSQNN